MRGKAARGMVPHGGPGCGRVVGGKVAWGQRGKLAWGRVAISGKVSLGQGGHGGSKYGRVEGAQHGMVGHDGVRRPWVW